MAAPFDAVAADYDADFTDTRLGRWYRQQVWDVLARTLPASGRVLELGCGTGEDAAWLAKQGYSVTGVDASSAMLAAARAKLTPDEGRVELLQVDLNDAVHTAAVLGDRGPFDAALSDFGVLNCVVDRSALAGTLAAVLAPGAPLVVVVMGPLCLWESVWHLAHGEWATGVRRLRGATTARLADDSTIEVDYPSPGRFRRELGPAFHHVSTEGLGVALPPTGLAALGRGGRVIPAVLHRWEERLRRHRAAAWVADHYLMVLERR